MRHVRWDPADPISAGFRAAVDERLDRFVAGQDGVLAEMGPELGPLRLLIRNSLTGGKRLRPAFCAWGFLAAAGSTDEPAGLLDAAASLELLHVSALVHDDVMDGSDLRRGQPAAHRWLETRHAEVGGLGDPVAYGRAGAILLGDLLLMWSFDLLRRAELPADAGAAAQQIAEVMRTEVTCGQYLDVAAQFRPLGVEDLDQDLIEANRVVEFKSARYSVQRPAQLGAAIGGGSPELLESLAAYGSPIGRAFQLRDDVLGVFGDPAVTGKPAGDDLREGKRTVLIAYAYGHTDLRGRSTIKELLGDPDLDDRGVARLQQVIIDTGALASVETMIDAGHSEAMMALDAAPITELGRAGLATLASLAVHRAA